MKSYEKLIAGVLTAWFVFALSASAMQLFSQIRVAVPVAAVAPIVLFSLWWRMSAKFRSFALSLNPRTLTLVHAWRLVGFTFVLLEAHSVLPALFALPAGYGDMLIGATATAVAWKLATPRHRDSFILWQLLGIADLVIAIGLGATAGLVVPHSIPMLAMTVLPLSLVPTFIVPLLLMLHFICILQAKGWQTASDEILRSAKPVHALSASNI